MNARIKKLIGASVLSILFLAAAIGSGSSDSSTDSKSDDKTNNSKETRNATVESKEEKESPVKIVSQKLSKDYDGKDVLIVEYEFTNTSDEPQSFMTAVTDKAFQNGVELSGMVIGCDDYSAEDQMKDIQPGVTFNVKGAYLLDDKSDVNIVVTEWIGDTEYINETISIS